MVSLVTGKVPPLITIIDSDYPSEITDFSEEQSFEVMIVKFLKGMPYSCPALRSLKGK